MTQRPFGHAVVVGGSVAGLLAAHVLAQRFCQVTLVERDAIDTDAHRAGVPHARHLHVLLRRGLDGMEELLPGFEAELIASGAERLQQGTDFRIRFRSGWAPRVPGLTFLSMTRALLERHIRVRVLANERIHVRASARVAGLTGDRDAVAGVLVDGAPLAADLVVDASGRTSAVAEWLATLGCAPPRETVVDAGWGYAMRIYQQPTTKPEWKQLLVLNRAPDQPRCGVLQPVEGGRWLVNLASVMKDYPPNDEPGFLEFARSLPTPEIYDALRDATPLSKIYGYRHTANRLRTFDELPARLIVLGDALCAFNPVYGQGMTVATLEVLALRDLLAAQSSLSALGRKLQRRAAKIVAGPWLFATSEDSRWPGTLGAVTGASVRMMHGYIDRVIDAIPDSPEVYARFQAVQHMTRSPSALFHPSVLRRVLFRQRRDPSPTHDPANVKNDAARSTSA